MLKVDKRWCSNCFERTVHNYVGSESGYEGLGLVIRGVLAAASLGTSEIIRDKYWQCSKCGEITRD